MNRRNFIQLLAFGTSATGVSKFVSADTEVTAAVEPISKTPEILDATGLTVKEYQAITTLILGSHEDVNVMSWELGLIPNPVSYTYHVGDVKYNGNFYFVNYYIEDIEQPYGVTKRIILTSIGKSRTRFYDKAEGNSSEVG